MSNAGRWFWTGWGINVLFGFLSLWTRILSYGARGGQWTLITALAASAAVLIVVRKEYRAPMTASFMFLGGLCSGGALSFFSVGWFLQNSPLLWRGAEFAFFAIPLTTAFVFLSRSQRPVPNLRLDPPDPAELSTEAMEVAVANYLSVLNPEIERWERQIRRNKQGALSILIVGSVCVIALSFRDLSSLSECMIIAFLGVFLTVVVFAMNRSPRTG